MSIPSVEEARQAREVVANRSGTVDLKAVNAALDAMDDVVRAYVEGELTPIRLTTPCDTCNETGKVRPESASPYFDMGYRESCPDCGGRGWEPDPETIELMVEAVEAVLEDDWVIEERRPMTDLYLHSDQDWRHACVGCSKASRRDVWLATDMFQECTTCDGKGVSRAHQDFGGTVGVQALPCSDCVVGLKPTPETIQSFWRAWIVKVLPSISEDELAEGADQWDNYNIQAGLLGVIKETE